MRWTLPATLLISAHTMHWYLSCTNHYLLFCLSLLWRTEHNLLLCCYLSCTEYFLLLCWHLHLCSNICHELNIICSSAILCCHALNTTCYSADICHGLNFNCNFSDIFIYALSIMRLTLLATLLISEAIHTLNINCYLMISALMFPVISPSRPCKYSNAVMHMGNYYSANIFRHAFITPNKWLRRIACWWKGAGSPHSHGWMYD